MAYAGWHARRCVVPQPLPVFARTPQRTFNGNLGWCVSKHTLLPVLKADLCELCFVLLHALRCFCLTPQTRHYFVPFPLPMVLNLDLCEVCLVLWHALQWHCLRPKAQHSFIPFPLLVLHTNCRQL